MWLLNVLFKLSCLCGDINYLSSGYFIHLFLKSQSQQHKIQSKQMQQG